LAAGTALHGYQILGVLGRGGFGITYRACDLLDQSFAIKEFFPRQFAVRAGHDIVVTSESDEAVFIDCRRRFLIEARLLSTLGRNGGTPGVVQVVTFFEANNTAYSVMELLAGETLDDLLRASVSLSPQVLLALLRGILTPLARVHAAGFLHRDIKPSNILIRPDGQPVLIDFGSARDMRPTGNTTYTQVYSGQYAPIEQMTHGAPQGPYTDIYSVGGVAYRAIGGKLADALARQQAVLSRAPDPLIPAAQLGRGRYPAFLLLAIDRALAVAANERPQRVEEMLALLDDTSDSETTLQSRRPAENPERGAAVAAPPAGQSAMPWTGLWSGIIRPFSRLPWASGRGLPRQAAAGQNISRGQPRPQPGIARLAVPAIIAAVAILLAGGAYLWFAGQNQPSQVLADMHVAVTQNGNRIEVKFPETTDTAKLIAALPYLARLKVTALDLSYTQIAMLPALQGLAALERLNVHGSQVMALQSLQGLTALRELDLSQTKVTALPPLQDQAVLERLDLSYSAITTLPSLDGLSALRELDLAHTNIAEVPPLDGLRSLRKLDLTDTKVTSLSGVQDLPDLHVTPERLRLRPEPAPEQRTAIATPPPAREEPVTPPAVPAWVRPLPEPPVPPPPAVYQPPSPPPAAYRPPSSQPMPTPPAPPRTPVAVKPPPVPKESPAAKAPAAPPPSSEPQTAVRQPSQSEEALAGYEYFQRGYTAFQSHNYAEAKSLYLRGAENGDPNSMYWLGQLYAKGLGVAPDYNASRGWYQKAADHGTAIALYSIGLLYLEGGPGMAKDCNLAREWLTRAVARGVSVAQPLLNRSCY
jgi:serine/threonine protein kinase